MTRFRARAGVAVVQDEVAIYVALLPDGPILVMEGIAALIWDGLRRSGRDGAVREVAETTGADVEAIRPVIDAFVDDLIERGLLIAEPD